MSPYTIMAAEMPYIGNAVLLRKKRFGYEVIVKASLKADGSVSWSSPYCVSFWTLAKAYLYFAKESMQLPMVKIKLFEKEDSNVRKTKRKTAH